MCGATDQQKQLEAAQASYYTTLQAQQTQEFGQASQVFKDIYAAMSPIVAQGPNQLGFSSQELETLNNTALQGTGQAYSAASQSVRQQEAAAGGSNFVPSGATEQINAQIAGQAAGQEGSELNQIMQADYSQGSQNYWAAAGDLAAATGTFSGATGAAGAANQGGSAASTTANDIAAASNSWMSAVSGAIGGVAGAVCPAEGSYYLMGDQTEKLVELLEIGDQILGIDDEIQTIELIESSHALVVSVTLENGLQVQNSLTHAFALSRGGFTVASKSLGREVSTIFGPSRIIDIKLIYLRILLARHRSLRSHGSHLLLPELRGH